MRPLLKLKRLFFKVHGKLTIVDGHPMIPTLPRARLWQIMFQSKSTTEQEAGPTRPQRAAICLVLGGFLERDLRATFEAVLATTMESALYRRPIFRSSLKSPMAQCFKFGAALGAQEVHPAPILHPRLDCVGLWVKAEETG